MPYYGAERDYPPPARLSSVTGGPSSAELERLGDVAGLYWRTCDQCAKQGVCLVNGDAYICEDCQAFHERALDAAHTAVRETGLVSSLRDYQIDVLTWAVVKAYTEFTDEVYS